MSWEPNDISSVCSQNSTLSGCSPAYMAFISLVVQYFGQSNDNYVAQTSVDSDEPEEYDFIIVGAGSAGCVLANRLSEISGWKILLLEAGIQEPLVPDVPAFGLLLRNSNIDWGYRTQPEKHSCRSKTGGSCAWARGKVMGGSSTINYLMYIRGQPRDYDDWAVENPGWSYQEVLPYFIKSENNRNSEIVRDSPGFHGTRGELTVEYLPYTDPNSKILIKAWEEIGYGNIDANANEHVGSLRYQTTSKDGERQSTNGAFIRPIANERSNLVIRIQAYASKILIDPVTKKASGIEYYLTSSSDKGPKKAFATKEVIVSAGAINSPKLLMLSGIGPKKDLEKLGIDVIQDLAVGKNLHDHVTIDGLMIKLSEKTETLSNFKQVKNDSFEYLKNHNNPISAMGTLSSGCFVRTHLEKIPDYPDMQFTFDGVNISDYLVLAEEINGMAALPLSYYDGINVRPVLIKIRSRGHMKLNQTDPTWGAPLLYPNYFGDLEDLKTVIAGIRVARRLFNTSAFTDNGFSLHTEPLPSCAQHEFDSDDYWSCVAMEYTNTIYHFVGTCKMGPRSDATAVVDRHLKVHGIEALRVVDASVMPTIIRGNTNAPTIMIAEKISDVIKKFYRSRPSDK